MNTAVTESGVLQSSVVLDSMIHQVLQPLRHKRQMPVARFYFFLTQVNQVLKSVPTVEPLFCDCSLEDDNHSECCEFRSVACEHDCCGDTMSANKLQAHDDVCPEKLVPCPCECGLRFKRKVIPAHTRECPFRLVECSFRCVGCNLVTMAKDMDEHVQVIVAVVSFFESHAVSF